MIEADESGEKSAWTPRSGTITSRGILVLGVGKFSNQTWYHLSRQCVRKHATPRSRQSSDCILFGMQKSSAHFLPVARESLLWTHSANDFA